jgi:hypothetical protein
LIARAQQKGICARRFSPEAAAGFLVSALNGLLIEHLFIGGSSVDTEGAVAMVGEWLFGESDRNPPAGGGAPV